ncbi:MAG: 4Fe-4S dicluster domain-containing protein [Bacillota bacterium]
MKPVLKANSKKCANCHLCSLMCSMENYGQYNLEKSAIRINSNFLENYNIKINYCLQCKQQYCLKTCPQNAIYVNDKQVIVIDENKCDTCSGEYLCVSACEFNGIYKNGGHPPVKCDLCKGKEPICAQVCPLDALNFVRG